MSVEESQYPHKDKESLILCVDGLIGVGKSTLCKRLSCEFDTVRYFKGRFIDGRSKEIGQFSLKFKPVFETAQTFALPALSTFGENVKKMTYSSFDQSSSFSGKSSKEFLCNLDREFYDSICFARSSIDKLKEVLKPTDKNYDAIFSVLDNFIDLSESRWKNEIFGIFQSVMISSSYSPLLNETKPIDYLNIKNLPQPSENKMVNCHSEPRHLFGNEISKKSESSRMIVKNVVLMDRDPKCNGIFYNSLDERKKLSPSSKFFYSRVYQHFTSNNMDNSFEIWLWCRPEKAVNRIKKRDRNYEKNSVTIDYLWEFQSCKLYTILLSFSKCITVYSQIDYDASFFPDNKKKDSSPVKLESISISGYDKPMECLFGGKYDLKQRKRPIFVVKWDDGKEGTKGYGKMEDILDKYTIFNNNCEKCLYEHHLPKVNIYVDPDMENTVNKNMDMVINKKFKFFDEESKKEESIEISTSKKLKGSDSRGKCEICSKIKKISLNHKCEQDSPNKIKSDVIMNIRAKKLSYICKERAVNHCIFEHFFNSNEEKGIVINIFLSETPEAIL